MVATLAPQSLRPGLVFEERGGRILGKLGVVVVAEICIHPAGFLWRSHLPGARPTPQLAKSAEKARAAVRFAVTAWIEAAALRVSRR